MENGQVLDCCPSTLAKRTASEKLDRNTEKNDKQTPEKIERKLELIVSAQVNMGIPRPPG